MGISCKWIILIFKSGSPLSTGADPKYLTTVIPYHMDNGPPDNQTLQALIKSEKIYEEEEELSYELFPSLSVLRAINDDSPTVPTLLTDYILKVLCPT